MPATAKDEPKPDPTPAPKTTTEPPAPASDAPATEVPAGRQPAGVYEFTGPIATHYLEVPLTARPADEDNSATVFDWPFSAPDDGRWSPTKKKPNQIADNAPPASEE
jgi:hypothetical protein